MEIRALYRLTTVSEFSRWVLRRWAGTCTRPSELTRKEISRAVTPPFEFRAVRKFRCPGSSRFSERRATSPLNTSVSGTFFIQKKPLSGGFFMFHVPSFRLYDFTFFPQMRFLMFLRRHIQVLRPPEGPNQGG